MSASDENALGNCQRSLSSSRYRIGGGDRDRDVDGIRDRGRRQTRERETAEDQPTIHFKEDDRYRTHGQTYLV